MATVTTRMQEAGTPIRAMLEWDGVADGVGGDHLDRRLGSAAGLPLADLPIVLAVDFLVDLVVAQVADLRADLLAALVVDLLAALAVAPAADRPADLVVAPAANLRADLLAALVVDLLAALAVVPVVERQGLDESRPIGQHDATADCGVVGATIAYAHARHAPC